MSRSTCACANLRYAVAREILRYRGHGTYNAFAVLCQNYLQNLYLIRRRYVLYLYHTCWKFAVLHETAARIYYGDGKTVQNISQLFPEATHEEQGRLDELASVTVRHWTPIHCPHYSDPPFASAGKNDLIYYTMLKERSHP